MTKNLPPFLVLHSVSFFPPIRLFRRDSYKPRSYLIREIWPVLNSVMQKWKMDPDRDPHPTAHFITPVEYHVQGLTGYLFPNFARIWTSWDIKAWLSSFRSLFYHFSSKYAFIKYWVSHDWCKKWDAPFFNICWWLGLPFYMMNKEGSKVLIFWRTVELKM